MAPRAEIGGRGIRRAARGALKHVLHAVLRMRQFVFSIVTAFRLAVKRVDMAIFWRAQRDGVHRAPCPPSTMRTVMNRQRASSARERLRMYSMSYTSLSGGCKS